MSAVTKKARLVTTLVIELDDPSDAPVFADAVTLVLKATRKLSLKGAVRVDAYGDLGGGDLEHGEAAGVREEVRRLAETLGAATLADLAREMQAGREVRLTVGEVNALAYFMPAPEWLTASEELERLRPDYRSAWKKLVGGP